MAEIGAKLLRHSKPEGDCIVWTRSTTHFGYGSLKYKQKNFNTHRLSAHIFLGMPLDSKYYVCHTCDNPACINPNHLVLADQKWNIADAMAKGRRYQPDNRGKNNGRYIHGNRMKEQKQEEEYKDKEC